MDVQVDRLGQIQTEDTHDGLCIYDISAGNQVKVIIKFGNVIYKGFYFVNGIQKNLYCLHRSYLL